jgi:hypothetical protein
MLRMKDVQTVLIMRYLGGKNSVLFQTTGCNRNSVIKKVPEKFQGLILLDDSSKFACAVLGKIYADHRFGKIAISMGPDHSPVKTVGC